ncbi:MAG: hypothetical protein LQ341_006534, partial [Variospora aurantia]
QRPASDEENENYDEEGRPQLSAWSIVKELDLVVLATWFDCLLSDVSGNIGAPGWV